MTVTFSFELDTKDIHHMKKESHYNHNYYKLDLAPYGDYFGYGQCDVLYEVFDEFSETYSYTLGYFDYNDSNGDFIECFTWTEMSCKTNDYTGGY